MRTMFKASILAAAVAMAVFSSPSMALTFGEVQSQLGGYHCSGSTCTQSVNSTRNEPTTISGQSAHVNESHSTSQRCGHRVGDFNSDCIPVSIVSGESDGYFTAPGPDKVIPTVVTTTKVLTFAPATGFGITTTVSTVDKP